LNFVKTISPVQSDEALVSDYQQTEDLQTLSLLYQKYMELVYGVCMKYLNNSEDAKDAVINIFEELVTKLKKHQVVYFKSWLYQLAKNHCLMILRKKKNYIQSIDEDIMHFESDWHLDEVMKKENALNQLHNCLDQLVVEQKQTIQLFYLENKCYKEIATLTDLEINKVKSYIQNGRRNLKICMDKNQTFA
jgi:RNA polymerase sigma-70 factor (ECF subfamily)